MTSRILIAGFGGQGILFAGKQLAGCAMHKGRHVSWLPSYGPEMRGGSASCSVIISDKEISSPIISQPDILIAFNYPSFLRFEPSVSEGGLILANSSLIGSKSERDDISAHYIPATEIATAEGLDGSVNVIMLGYLLYVTRLFDYDEFIGSFLSGIPASKSALIEGNKKALRLGYEYR